MNVKPQTPEPVQVLELKPSKVSILQEYQVSILVLTVALVFAYAQIDRGTLQKLLPASLVASINAETILAFGIVVTYMIAISVRDLGNIGGDLEKGVRYADVSLLCANVALFSLVQCLFYLHIASKQYDNLLLNKFGILSEYLKRDRPLKPLLCDSLMSSVHIAMFRNVGTESPEGYTVAARPDIVEALTVHANEETIHHNVVVEEGLLESEPKECFAVTGTDGRVYYFVRQDNIFEAARKEADENYEHNRWTVATWGGPYVVIFGLITIVLFGIALRQQSWKSHHSFGALLVAGCFTTEIIYFFGVFRTYQVAGDWKIFHTLFKRKFGD